MFETFIKMTYFSVKWPEKGWYNVKQNKQPTNQNSHRKINSVSNYVRNKMYLHNHFKQANTSYLVAISAFLQ